MAKYNLLFPLDVTEIKVVSPFGMRKHPVTGVTALHEGIDLPPKTYRTDGDNIFASEDCEIRNSAWNNAGGNYMCLRGLSTGLYYNYQHLLKRNYSAGKRVKRGTVIAQMGNTGNSTTGTHLHFAIGTDCSPAGFIPKNAEALNPISNLFSWVFKANDKPTPRTSKYAVLNELNGYMSAMDAKGRRNPRVRVKVGNYDIFNTSQGMINVTKKAGTAGSWINPADNIVVKPTPKPTPKPEDRPVLFSVKLKSGLKQANIALTPNGALYSPPIYVKPNIEHKIRGVKKDAKGRDWYWRYDGGYVYSGHVNKVGEKLKSNTEIAKEVIAGKWGNGSERIKRLTSAGYDARAIQTAVNKLLK